MKFDPQIQPLDPANGRFLCTAEHPMPQPRPYGTHWSHADVEELSQEDGWPAGDIVICRCRICREQFSYELPQ